MRKVDLSILIPARNEQFLERTIQDLLENIEGRTEIIVGLDGQWADPPLPQDPRLSVIYVSKSLGQRGMTNQLARIAKGKYVMKTDAHCAFDKGFDIKMMDKMEDDITMIPEMRNLHVFDWQCKKCGNKWFQGPTPTCCYSDYDKAVPNVACDSTEFERVMVWKWNNKRGKNWFYRFDKTLHFQYFREYGKREGAKPINGLVETMSAQGSCFMLTRKKYFELDICDEAHGSWGQQGVEVACKTWLSGGRLMTNTLTWYAHLFRTQGGDFGFPYPNTSVEQAREFSRELWLNNKWPKAIYPLEWLVNKFAPVPEWDFTGGALYYSDGELDEKILKACQFKIKEGIKNRKLVSVTLKPMVGFGDNIHLELKRGYLTMAKQILYGLEFLDTDIVFFTEHDVLYHPSHFDFIPTEKDVFYYNTNVWRVRASDGFAVKVDDCKQLSGLCANREFLVTHYKKRVEMLQTEWDRLVDAKDQEKEFVNYVRNMGFEPGTHGRKEKVDGFKAEAWQSKHPNVDIRHGTNATSSRWRKDQFKNQKYTRGWIETTNIPGWGEYKTFFNDIY